ncbi:MAG: NAD-dependent epimerase/dehydratase family protein [Halobacteriota archaeon]|jgi:UDP-glucose 4-epimerase
MIALVTGGYGFIGNQIAELISPEYAEVRILDNLSNVARVVRLPNVRLIKTDIRDIGATNEAFDDVDVVFHTAAQVDVVASTREPFVDMDNNVKGTLSVCEAARRNDVSKLVYSSSAAVYGNAASFPIDEAQPIRPLSPYAVSKHCGELYMAAYHNLYGLSTLSLRYFNVYGPYQRPENAYSGVISTFFYNATRNAPLQIHGDGNQTRDFVYVTDVANANLLAASSDAANAVVNIGSGRETSINELAMMIKKMALSDSSIAHGAPRISDGRRSLADIRNAKRIINYEPKIRIDGGLAKLRQFFGDTR